MRTKCLINGSQQIKKMEIKLTPEISSNDIRVSFRLRRKSIVSKNIRGNHCGI